MKDTIISKKDIIKNENYKQALELLEREKINFDWLVDGAVTFGCYWEKNYNIRNDQEWWDKRSSYINEVANRYNGYQEELLSKVQQILIENIAMKKVLKEAKINLHITD